jgi:hypothetical protein
MKSSQVVQRRLMGIAKSLAGAEFADRWHPAIVTISNSAANV